MAHSLSAKKRIRQNIRARALNRWRLRSMREGIKAFNQAMLHGTPEEAREAYRKVVSLIDKTASKGIIHKRQADRRKSRLNTRLKAKTA